MVKISQSARIPYKYGAVILTNDEEWFDQLGNIQDGIYTALELPEKMHDKIVGRPWMRAWLESSEHSLFEKLKDKIDGSV